MAHVNPYKQGATSPILVQDPMMYKGELPSCLLALFIALFHISPFVQSTPLQELLHFLIVGPQTSL